MANYDESKVYIKYIEDVLSGKQIEGWFVIKACERAKSWFDRDDIELRYEEVDSKIRLVQKVKQQKGLQAGKPFLLLPFQQFIFMNIFGWYFVGTDKRVINNVLIMMARQTGKTYIASAIAIAIALDKTLPSPTVDFIANSAKQSAIAFGHCKDQCASLDPKGKIFKRYRQQIRIPITGASINILSADDSKLDGRASYFVSDEIHENKNWKIWEILKSGQGSLKNPLAIGISTAGWWIGEEYPLYSMWTSAKNILSGYIEDDSWFYMIFQLDETDDWKDPSVWHKAVPTLGLAVDEDFMRKRIQEAINVPSKEIEIKTKNLNMWCQSSQVWIPKEKIDVVCEKFDLDMFDEEDDVSIVGVDIAEVNDLASISVLVEHDDKVYFKSYPFVCKAALKESRWKDFYNRWIDDGYMIFEDDEAIDLDWVINKVEEINEKIPIALVAYDPYRGRQLKAKCYKAGIPCKGVGQGIANFSEPTMTLESYIRMGKQIVIDDNPVTKWCFSNVLLARDVNNNVKPEKSDGRAGHNKIDIVITMLMTFKLWMDLKGITGSNEVVVLE